jgi:hypothetical protein
MSTDRYVLVTLLSPETGKTVKIGSVIEVGSDVVIDFLHDDVIAPLAYEVMGKDYYDRIEEHLKQEMNRVKDLGEDGLAWLSRFSTVFVHYSTPCDFPPDDVIKIKYQAGALTA